MNLKNLSDTRLITEIENLVQQERETLTAVLHYLREIERRRLYSDYGFGSLFEFTVKRLGYSESQAYRRIAAMRLVKEMPEIEEKIESGDISLTNLAMAHSFFRQEKKYKERVFSPEEKLNVIGKLQNKSTREAEKIILSLAPSMPPMSLEKNRQITSDLVELKLIISNSLLEKIKTLKGLLAHTSPDLSAEELLEKLCELGFEKWSKNSLAAPKNRCVKSLNDRSAPQEKSQTDSQNKKLDPIKLNSPLFINKAEIRRMIWRRANGKCENCSSRFVLEIDHIIPRAKGGEDTLENLRILCRPCNQRAAIKEFGLQKMEEFLEKK